MADRNITTSKSPSSHHPYLQITSLQLTMAAPLPQFTHSHEPTCQFHHHRRTSSVSRRLPAEPMLTAAHLCVQISSTHHSGHPCGSAPLLTSNPSFTVKPQSSSPTVGSETHQCRPLHHSFCTTPPLIQARDFIL
ncbi:hypothetical protein M0R45_005302 [Rubus argutus]|uniref:Uncharacterized protein n=1 Tax=Rubus argutus TaxID=59490 RepID=A0AAW1YMT3_RUBAR